MWRERQSDARAITHHPAQSRQMSTQTLTNSHHGKPNTPYSFYCWASLWSICASGKHRKARCCASTTQQKPKCCWSCQHIFSYKSQSQHHTGCCEENKLHPSQTQHRHQELTLPVFPSKCKKDTVNGETCYPWNKQEDHESYIVSWSSWENMILLYSQNNSSNKNAIYMLYILTLKWSGKRLWTGYYVELIWRQWNHESHLTTDCNYSLLVILIYKKI